MLLIFIIFYYVDGVRQKPNSSVFFKIWIKIGCKAATAHCLGIWPGTASDHSVSMAQDIVQNRALKMRSSVAVCLQAKVPVTHCEPVSGHLVFGANWKGEKATKWCLMN